MRWLVTTQVNPCSRSTQQQVASVWHVTSRQTPSSWAPTRYCVFWFTWPAAVLALSVRLDICCVCVRVCVYEWVGVWERERQCVCVCDWVHERECVCVCVRVYVCVWMSERERMIVCVCDEIRITPCILHLSRNLFWGTGVNVGSEIHLFFPLPFIPQLRLIAYDSAHPKRTAQTTVQFFVRRNPNDPVFQPNANYDFSISETADLGSFVGNVTATDRDNVCWNMYFSLYFRRCWWTACYTQWQCTLEYVFFALFRRMP